MASRFWVGGTGTWDAVTTTHWSATTGGAGGASVPTSADAVFLDANSVGTITLSASQEIASIDCTGFVGTLAGANFTLSFNTAGGNATFVAGMTVTSLNLNWHSLVSGTLTSGGKTFTSLTIGGGTTGGTVTLGDTNTISGAVTLTSGTLNTNGQTCTWGSFNGSNSNTRIITLGASAISCSLVGGIPWDCTTATGLTITANTATVTFTGSGSPTFRSGGANWNGLSLTFANTTGGGSISGNGTFKNVTMIGPAAASQTLAVSTGTTTITSTLTLTGLSATQRILVVSGLLGSPATLNAVVVALTNVDFMDVTGAGAAAPFTGTSLGNALGNSGITFTPAVSRFAVAAGNFSSTAMWSATSGGAPGASVPLPQDSVSLDANSAAGTYTADIPRIGKDINFTGFTRTFNHAIAITFYGSWTASATMTWNGAGGYVCGARSSVTLTTAGKSAPTTLTMNGPTGTLTFQDAYTGNAAIGISLTAGTLRTIGNAVSIGNVSGPGTLTRVLDLGASVVSLTGGSGTLWNFTGTGATIIPGTSIIDFVDTTAGAKTFAGNGLAYSTVRDRAVGSGSLTLTGNNIYVNLDVEVATLARTLALPGGGCQYITGTLTLIGSASQLLSVTTTAGNQTVLWVLPGGTLNQSFTTANSDIVVVTGQNLAMQNVITDASRTAALSWGIGQQGGSTDGLPVGSGVGIYRGGTNLFRHAQNDTTGDWSQTGTGVITIATDATVRARFSPQSIKVTTDGTAAQQGAFASSAAGQAAPAGQLEVAAVDVKGVAGQSYIVRAEWLNTDASVTLGANTTFVATGAMQTVVPAGVAVAAGKTGDAIRVRVIINGTRAESFWVAHPMGESLSAATTFAYVSPYIATSGGATAGRSASRVQAPSSLLATAQGFAAARFIAWTPDTGPSGGVGFPIIFEWGTIGDSTTRSDIFYLESSKRLDFSRRVAGVAGSDASSAVQSFAAGATLTATGRWTTVDNAISAGGSAFSTTADARLISPNHPAFDIGSGGGATHINASFRWFAVGKGIPGTADAAALGAASSTDPALGVLTGAAQLSAVMPFDSSSPAYEVPLALVSPPVVTLS